MKLTATIALFLYSSQALRVTQKATVQQDQNNVYFWLKHNIERCDSYKSTNGVSHNKMLSQSELKDCMHLSSIAKDSGADENQVKNWAAQVYEPAFSQLIGNDWSKEVGMNDIVNAVGKYTNYGKDDPTQTNPTPNPNPAPAPGPAAAGCDFSSPQAGIATVFSRCDLDHDSKLSNQEVKNCWYDGANAIQQTCFATDPNKGNEYYQKVGGVWHQATQYGFKWEDHIPMHTIYDIMHGKYVKPTTPATNLPQYCHSFNDFESGLKAVWEQCDLNKSESLSMQEVKDCWWQKSHGSPKGIQDQCFAHEQQKGQEIYMHVEQGWMKAQSYGIKWDQELPMQTIRDIHYGKYQPPTPPHPPANPMCDFSSPENGINTVFNMCDANGNKLLNLIEFKDCTYGKLRDTCFDGNHDAIYQGFQMFYDLATKKFGFKQDQDFDKKQAHMIVQEMKDQHDGGNDEVKKIFEQCDHDRNGLLTWQEATQCLENDVHQKIGHTFHYLRKAFSAYQQAGANSQGLTPAQVEQALRH